MPQHLEEDGEACVVVVLHKLALTVSYSFHISIDASIHKTYLSIQEIIQLFCYSKG